MSDNAKCSCAETCALHLHINRYAIGNARESERERETRLTWLTELERGAEEMKTTSKTAKNSTINMHVHVGFCVIAAYTTKLATRTQHRTRTRV